MQIYIFIEPKFRPDKHHLCTGSQNNERSRRNLAEKLVYFAGCRLLSTTLVMNNIKCCILRVRIKLSLLHLHGSISTPPPLQNFVSFPDSSPWPWVKRGTVSCPRTQNNDSATSQTQTFPPRVYQVNHSATTSPPQTTLCIHEFTCKSANILNKLLSNVLSTASPCLEI